MDKAQLIKYLKTQAKKVDKEGFDLQVWKEATASTLKQALGEDHSLVSQVLSLEYSYTTSIEELYPKKVLDLEASKLKFKSAIEEVISQVEVFGIPRDKGSGVMEVLKAELDEKDYQSIQQKPSEVEVIFKDLNKEKLLAILGKIIAAQAK